QFKLTLPSRLKVRMTPAVAFGGVLDVFQKLVIPFARIFPSSVWILCPSSHLIHVLSLAKHADVSPILLAFRCVCAGEVSSGLMALHSLSLSGSILSFSANIFMALSMAKVSSLCPNPRKDVA